MQEQFKRYFLKDLIISWKSTGNNIRGHALRPEDILDIVNNLDNPSTIILQTNRQNTNGEHLPNNVAVFVEYSNNGNEGVAVVEFDSFIDSEFIGTEFGDTNYHTVVTIFEPDTERYGMPFDYADELLSNPDNFELEIVRRQPTESAIGKKHPNTSSELPSKSIIPQNQNKSSGNAKYSLSAEGEQIAPAGNYNVCGKDVALEEELHPIREDIAPAVDETVDDIAPPIPKRVTRTRDDAKANTPSVTDDDFAPIRKDVKRTLERKVDLKYLTEEDIAPEAMTKKDNSSADTIPGTTEEIKIKTTNEKLTEKRGNYETELESNRQNRESAKAEYDKKIAAARLEYSALKNKNTGRANTLLELSYIMLRILVLLDRAGVYDK